MYIKRDYRSRERGCITKMRKELELETLEERRQSLRLILMYKVVEGLVPALPTDAFVTFRQIKPKTFGDCETSNPVEKHKTNNTKCLTIPNRRTPQYQNSFLIRGHRHTLEPSTRHSCMRKVPWGIQDRPSGPAPINQGAFLYRCIKTVFRELQRTQYRYR
jgi:hypothetical protein